MYITTHDQNIASIGEPVKIVFTVTNAAGEDEDVSTASAAYKIARRKGGAAFLTKTDASGITLAGNKATVEYNTNEVLSSETQVIGDLIDQLAITKDGNTLWVSEGIMTIELVNT